MARYFIEVAYKGTRFSGFQVQANAHTIQAEIEKALNTISGLNSSTGDKGVEEIKLTGSSRTDAGVHALQNYFHFDYEGLLHPQLLYKLNAVISKDIVVKNLYNMPSDAHARFDAISREYQYNIHQVKDPFLHDTSFYYPYKLDPVKLKEAAALVKQQSNFFAFAKTNSQVSNFICTINVSEWEIDGSYYYYIIKANRFLRGMVRLVTASLLKVGRSQMTLEDLEALFNSTEKCGYSVPAHGLFLRKVNYPSNYFSK